MWHASSMRLLLCVQSSCLFAAPVPEPEMRLGNGVLEVTFGPRGLAAIRDKTLDEALAFEGDSFALRVDGATVESTELPAGEVRGERDAIVYGYRWGERRIEAIYELKEGWRSMGWWYRMENFVPVEIMPGYMMHQTMRNDREGRLMRSAYRTRDFDYLGWKYSVISSIATAPVNHVVNYIPARDETEFRCFAEADCAWLRGWLDWTDARREILGRLRPIIGQPLVGRCDGTAAVQGEEGFVFLFNPNYRALTATFALDASIGLTEGRRFVFRTLYQGVFFDNVEIEHTDRLAERP